MIIKTVSIYAWKEVKNEEHSFLTNYIKKGYKRYFDYVELQNNFDWDMFAKFIIDREEEISEIKRSNIIMVVMYLLGDRIDYSHDFVRNKLENLVRDFYVIPNGDESFQEKFDKLETSRIQKLNKVLGFKIKKSIIIDELISNHREYLIRQFPVFEKNKIKWNQENIFDYTSKMGLIRYYIPLTDILKELTYNFFNFSGNCRLTRKELIAIDGLFEFYKKDGRLQDKDYEFFLAASINLMMMVKHYRELSEIYFKKISQEQEIIFEKNKLQQEKVDIRKEKALLEEELLRMQKLLEDKDKQNFELEKSIKTIKAEVVEHKALKKEIVALREYVFCQDEEIIEEEPEEKLDFSVLLSKKVVIIGGHQRWHQKVEQFLPQIRTIHPSEISIDLSFIQNMDIICFETSYNNHAIYRRVMNEAEKSNGKLHYINSQLNINRLIKELINLNQ